MRKLAVTLLGLALVSCTHAAQLVNVEANEAFQGQMHITSPQSCWMEFTIAAGEL